MSEFNVQTRSETNGLRSYQTVREALEASDEDSSIWKISFDRDGERLRLVKSPYGWMLRPIFS